MLDFNFYSPTYFVFGRGREREAGAFVRRFGGTKALVHYGGGSAVASGLIGRVKASLAEAGVACVELGGVRPNPRDTLVYEGISLCRKEKVDFVLAVGGGSVIDSAKAIAAGVPYDGDFWDFYQGKFVEEALPIGTVLTIAAAGSEGSPDSVVTKEEGQFKRDAHGEVLRPKFSILNPALTQTLPPYQTACGATDIIAHVLERYFTNTPEVEITDRLCEAVLKTMIYETPRALADKDNYDARANIMWAGMVAHNDLCGVGREQDWASHFMEHELSAQYDCAHGAGLAVMFPAWMRYVLPHDPTRFAMLQERLWGEAPDGDPVAMGERCIERFKAFFESIGMPTSFAALGAKEEDIETMAHRCCWGDKRTGVIGGFVKLTQEDVEKIYRSLL